MDELTIKNYKEKIQLQYETNNIIHEKSELYCDFLISLVNIINETYLGPELISTDKEIKNHFYWCFNKILDNFKHERIYFNDLSVSDYNYLWYFIYTAFYLGKTEDKHGVLLDYFKYLFDHKSIKRDREIELYVDLYKILDKNLKKIN